MTWWNSGKVNAGDPDGECPEGDAGALEMGPVSLTNLNLRDGDGFVINPLPYGQSEIHIFIARNDDMPNQCYKYRDIKLEIYAECEKPDGDSNQETYQYRTKMDESTGEVTVIHPVWNNATHSWALQEDGTPTAARGMAKSTNTISVLSWAQTPTPEPEPEPESCELGACAARLFEKRGCTYPEATNYDEEATFDDKSCDFRARLEPVLVQGSFCIAGVNVSSSSSIEDMVRVLVQVVTGLTEGASFSFDVSTADSCGPGGTTRRLQESAPVVVAGYSIGVKSQNVAEASAIANILKDSRQLTTQMHELNSEATIQTADAVVVADTLAPTPGPTPGPTAWPTAEPTAEPTRKPTPAPIAEETEGPTSEPTSGPTPAHTPCRPCMTQSDCDGSEICEFPSARRGLRFGSIQQEGCCHAR